MATTEPAAKKTLEPDLPAFEDDNVHHLVYEQTANDVFLLLILFRLINAACVQTFFQPDEYFQSLEPAWQMAFGPDSGAWITWEWQHQLRSSLHPALFAIFYYVVDKPMEYLMFFPQFRAMILAILPNLVQACFSAMGEYFMWQLTERIYGIGSNTAWAALFLSVLSPWQWFCSTRTFSNSLETTMTIVALYYWPWELTCDTFLGTGSSRSLKIEKKTKTSSGEASRPGVLQTPVALDYLRNSLLLAVAAIILRPTNALIWFCIAIPTLTRLIPSKDKAPTTDIFILIREALICVATVLAISVLSDHSYYGTWTFPPYQLLNFNISQDIAVFYGRNDWHYYLSQGLPLLLTTALPFTLTALWKSSSLQQNDIRFLFTTIVLVSIATLSLISHKEVRFIYPLLPILHILTAPIIVQFFTTTTTIPAPPPDPLSKRPKGPTTHIKQEQKPQVITKIIHKTLLYSLIILNIIIATYTTQIHQTGPLAVTKYLRQQYELLALDGRGIPLSSPLASTHDFIPKHTNYDPSETFAAFLMPCHSTPWRSSLFHPGLKAWALTCEPPIHIPASNTTARAEYRDEADRFYDDPKKFLEEEVGGRERPWPRFVVGFEGIEGALREWYEGVGEGRMRERWRTRSSQWHDDWRRKGDIVVWEFVEME